MSEIDYAWAAGIFEGEGTITIHGTQVSLSVTMSDVDVVNRLADVLGGRLYNKPPQREGYKPLRVWGLYQKDAVIAALNHILPWLGVRRTARTIQALAALANNPGSPRYRTACARGHEYVADSYIIRYRPDRGPSRRCLICQREDYIRKNELQP